MSDRYCHFDFEKIVAKTERAILIRFDDDMQEWVPVKQVENEAEDYKRGDGPGTICIQRWWCEKNGLE